VRDDADRKAVNSASCYSSEQIGNNNRSKKKLRAALLRGTRYSPMEIPARGARRGRVAARVCSI